jgi:hypothetical protein
MEFDWYDGDEKEYSSASKRPDKKVRNKPESTAGTLIAPDSFCRFVSKYDLSIILTDLVTIQRSMTIYTEVWEHLNDGRSNYSLKYKALNCFSDLIRLAKTTCSLQLQTTQLNTHANNSRIAVPSITPWSASTCPGDRPRPEETDQAGSDRSAPSLIELALD